MQQIANSLILSLCVTSCALFDDGNDDIQLIQRSFTTSPILQDEPVSLIQSLLATARLQHGRPSEADLAMTRGAWKSHLALNRSKTEAFNDDTRQGGEQHANGLLVAICFVIPTVFGGFLIWNTLGVNTPTDASDPEVLPMQPKQSHMKKKLHPTSKKSTWRRQLGKFLESSLVSIIIVILVLADCSTSILGDLLEHTDLLNPKYEEQGEVTLMFMEKISLIVLVAMMIEQILLLLAFGEEFFGHFFYVMDVIVVYISFLSDAVLGPKFEQIAGWLIILRLWKVASVILEIVDLIED